MQLLTLGGLRLDGVEFSRPKPLLLLCYLSIEGSQSRRVLADLFFAATKHPRDSLSTAFRQLRSIGEDVVLVDGDRLEAAIDSDATKLIEALDAGLLEPAIEMYDGAFLDGLDLELGEELEEWVFATREYLGGRVREALWRVAEERALSRDPTAATRHAEAALDLEGAPDLDPDDLPRAYRLLAAGSSPRSSDVRDMALEFDIDLDSPDDDKFLDVRDDTASTAPNNLPPPTTSFVGRDVERLEIAGLLHSSHARIITIHGPGGIGKSRLALRAARDQVQGAGFRDGVFRVDLEPLTHVRQIAESIAAHLGESTASSLELLTEAIGSKRVLCVLDGFEHLVDGAKTLSNLVASCGNLRFLVTSRERLRLDEEHVITLPGLATPSAGAPKGDALASDALQLAVQRAKKVRIDFSLDGKDLDHAIEICRRLDGSPLGIELAMSWIRVMSIADIHRELDQDLSLLQSDARNVKASHRSIRAVFERSWSLLADRDRDVLARLALFRGGFRREAAIHVADATLTVLARLVDASLISVDSDGRYRVHALIQEFCSAKLEEDRRRLRDTVSRYREHFRKQAAAHLGAMYTSEEPRALSVLLADLPNILSAWEMIFEAEYELQRLFPSQLVVFFDRLGLMHEGTRFFERARAALENWGRADPAFLRQVDANLAWLYYRRGKHEQAARAARAALSDPNADDVAAMVASNTLALVLMDTSRTPESIEPFERAVDIATRLGDHTRAAMYLVNLARAHKTVGDFESSIRFDERAIEIAEQHRYPYALALATNNLGATLENTGNMHAALERYRRALDVCEREGYDYLKVTAIANLAECSFRLGKVSDAAEYLKDLRTHVPEHQDDILESLYLHIKGAIKLSEGDVEAAESSLLEALRIAKEHLHDERHIKILPDLAKAWISQGRLVEARRLLDHVLREAPPGTQPFELAARTIGDLEAIAAYQHVADDHPTHAEHFASKMEDGA